MDAFEKYGIKFKEKDLLEFDHGDKVKILTFHVGTIVPRVLKDLDSFIDKNKEFSSKQISLLIKGKKDKRPNYQMTNYPKEYLDFYEDLEMDIIKTTEDIMEEIITDMGKYNKNLNRKNKFFNTLNTLNGQILIFVISLMSIGEHMINKYGRIINGRYLEHVLIARAELTKEIKEIYKNYSKGIITQEEVNNNFRSLINNKVQDLIKFDSRIYKEIKTENDLYKICDKDSITREINNLVESCVIKTTSSPRLISLFEI